MRSLALCLIVCMPLAACETAPEDPNAEAPAVYRSESSTGSNIARRVHRPPSDEESARAREDAEAMMRADQIRRANMRTGASP